MAEWEDRLSDALTNTIGTMKFVYVSTIVIFFWILFNIIALFGLQWDAYPFVFLNLGFSAFAYYSAPLILMSQNRQTLNDRARQEQDLATDLEALALIKNIALKLEVSPEE